MHLKNGIITGDKADGRIGKRVVEHGKNSFESRYSAHSFSVNPGAICGRSNILLGMPSFRNHKEFSVHESHVESGIHIKENHLKIDKTIVITTELRNENRIHVFDTATINSIGSMMSGVQEIKDLAKELKMFKEAEFEDASPEVEENIDQSGIYGPDGEIQDYNKYFGIIEQEIVQDGHPITVESYRGLTPEDELVRDILLKLSDIVDEGKKELSEILDPSDLEFCKILVSTGSKLFSAAYTSAVVGIAEKFGGKEAGEKIRANIEDHSRNVDEICSNVKEWATDFVHSAQERYAQSQEDYYKIGNGLSGMFSVIGFGAAIQFKMKQTVKRVGERFPRNARYAGIMYDITKLPLELQKKYPHGVPFTAAGFPDFSRYAIRKVQINVTGVRDTDFAIADKAAGFNKRNPRPTGYTWHHHEDCKTMLLVPFDLHSKIGHSGGVSLIKNSKKYCGNYDI